MTESWYERWLRKAYNSAERDNRSTNTKEILGVAATVSDSVNEGDIVCIIEALMLENQILAPVKVFITQVGSSLNQVVKTAN